MEIIFEVLAASWHLLLDSALYIILGLLVAGMLKSFLSTDFVARHLGRGRFGPVFKAALLGVPIPLCSCGVMPAAASLKKQGASNGATIAFMVSTPESGIDSISISYALLDPLLTIARPVAAFFSAMLAGSLETIFGTKKPSTPPLPMHSLTDACGPGCSDQHHEISAPGLASRLTGGIGYAFRELWGDLAGWFAFGLLLSGLITVMVPDELISSYLGGGPFAMLIMLVVGIPIYICASASTPIAASLILKGVSPGAALVFLLAGPATNLTSLSMLTGMLGRNGTLRYLVSLAASSFLCGLLLDQIYQWSGIKAQAVIGQAGEIFPHAFRLGAALFLILLSVLPVYRSISAIANRFMRNPAKHDHSSGCNCSSTSCRN